MWVWKKKEEDIKISTFCDSGNGFSNEASGFVSMGMFGKLDSLATHFDFLEHLQHGWCDWWLDSFHLELLTW